MTNDTFENNLHKFALKNPRGSILLAFVDAGSLCVTEDAQEAIDWVQTLNLDGVEYIAVFGLGMGYGYDALKTWLEGDSSRRLIFLEDDLRVLLLFLESDRAKDLLDDPQVHIYYTEDSQDGLEVLQNLAWSAYGKNMLITCMPFYQAERKKTFDDITARLQYETSDIHIVLDEYMTHGVSFFRNFWKNLFLLPGSYKGNKLQGAFKGIPAIVVAAGPSLEQHLPELKELRDKALIFSGGSSVNALLDAQILPHFGAGIDPNPTQYLRFRQALAFQVPFFYRNRLLTESAELIQGPRLYLKGGDGYNISDWFEKKCKITGSIIGGGHSVANFIIEIAHSLGCSPIILVGYDLSYGKDQQLYAPGVEDPQVTAARDENEPITWQDKAGKTIKTAWKW
ncbi:MAG: DUF115 domain-containing protein, partial [Chlamydiales bacterium]|nr:DUF115 domain-containing protein [Chlamydiales bacterium]